MGSTSEVWGGRGERVWREREDRFNWRVGVSCLNQFLPVEFSSQSRNSASAKQNNAAGGSQSTCFLKTDEQSLGIVLYIRSSAAGTK